MHALVRSAYRSVARVPSIALVFCFLAGCADVQMGYNVLTYDYAVADTANQQLLLNAVRASQHYPRSFTSVGQLVGSPQISGTLGSTLNFTGLAGLSTYNLNPAVSAGAGYSQFTLQNLNAHEFLVAIREPVSPKITESFYKSSSWPRQLLDLVYIQKFSPTVSDVRSIDATRKAKCRASADIETAKRCELVNRQIGEFSLHCDSKHFVDINTRIRQFKNDRGMYYNTAVNSCHYARFRIFLEEAVLAGFCKEKLGGCPFATERSPFEMIGYLGELIAAQNYIEQPFVPRVMYGYSVGTEFKYVDVPLFVVNRGEPAGSAAVVVSHQGTTYYIPRPDFGSPDEAQSMQTLELVLQTVQAAIPQKNLPTAVPPVAPLKP